MPTRVPIFEKAWKQFRFLPIYPRFFRMNF